MCMWRIWEPVWLTCICVCVWGGNVNQYWLYVYVQNEGGGGVVTVIPICAVLAMPVYVGGWWAFAGYEKFQLHYMRGSRKFCQRGSSSPNVCCCFFVGERIQIPLKAGHYWPVSETPFKWLLAGGPMMVQRKLCESVIFQGNRPVLLRNPIFLTFFRGGSGPPSLLWTRARTIIV